MEETCLNHSHIFSRWCHGYATEGMLPAIILQLSWPRIESISSNIYQVHHMIRQNLKQNLTNVDYVFDEERINIQNSPSWLSWQKQTGFSGISLVKCHRAFKNCILRLIFRLNCTCLRVLATSHTETHAGSRENSKLLSTGSRFPWRLQNSFVSLFPFSIWNISVHYLYSWLRKRFYHIIFEYHSCLSPFRMLKGV